MNETVVHQPGEGPSPARRRAGTFLGRLSQALREQSWVAVMIEVGIVVLGVVMGFQVTAWGAERAERAEEQALLQGLRSEFEEVLAGIDAQVAKHRRVESAVQAIVEALAQAERNGERFATIPDDTLVWALVATTTQFSQGILGGILVSGRLGLIRDPALRRALAEWGGVLADVTEDEQASRELVMKDLEPTLRSRMDIRPFRRYAHHLGTLPLSEAGASSQVPVELETTGVFASRLYWLQHVIREFEEPKVEARRMLALIDRSLE